MRADAILRRPGARFRAATGYLSAAALMLGALAACDRGGETLAGGTSSETVIGRVVLPDGTPAAGVQFKLREAAFLADPALLSKSAAGAGPRKRSGITDAEGRYRMDSLEPGDYRLEFYDDRGMGLLLPLGIPSAGTGPRPVPDTLRATGVLEGQILASNSDALPATFGRGYVQIYGLDRVVRPDSSGRFRFGNMPPGRFRLRAFTPFPFLQAADRTGLELRPGDSLDVGSVRLDRILTSNFTSVVPDGLIAYWPFDEGAGAVTADPVGGYDGRLQGGCAWSQGVRDGALTLDGRTGFVSLPTLYLPGDFSIAAWVRLRGLIDNNQLLVGMDDSTNLNFAQGRFRLYEGGAFPAGSTIPSWDPVIAHTAVKAETWTHVAVTRQKGELAVYVGGKADGTGNWAGTFLLNHVGLGLRLLSPESRGVAHFEGDLDELRVYDRGLTAEEAAALAAPAAAR